MSCKIRLRTSFLGKNREHYQQMLDFSFRIDTADNNVFHILFEINNRIQYFCSLSYFSIYCLMFACVTVCGGNKDNGPGNLWPFTVNQPQR